MNKDCTVYKAADFIGKRWSLNILLEIYKGKEKVRYSTIKNKIPGITAKILSLRLKELERLGLITHDVDTSSSPVKSYYSLTESGGEFIKIIKDIKAWALKYQSDSDYCRTTQCRHCLL